MPAGLEITAVLQLSSTDDVLVVKKLFLADDEPVILALNHIPTKLIERAYVAEDFRMPVYRFLGEYV